MPKKWFIKTPNPHLQVQLSNVLKIHPIVSQLLVNRGVKTPEEAKQFLFSDFKDLHDPFLLKDMDKAVNRIRQAKDNGEVVLVFGDYDVDGVTSSAILTKALKKLGIKVINHIPHRLTDGYGLNHEIAKEAKEKGVSLLISVDCGISAIEEAKTLKDNGIDVIIVDHHEPLKENVPDAVAVIDPKRKDCPYPFGGLAAVALAFKLAQALHGTQYIEDLDLVALGTIADVVPLYGENRIFVKSGLPAIEKTKNFGLRALMDGARIKKKLTPRHVGFILGPRINAMGRIDSAEKSLQLLLSESADEARGIAQVLEDHNKQRQKMQTEIIDAALKKVEQEVNFKTDRVIVVGEQGWHRGVVGIVAARIMDTYYRPTIVLSIEEGIAVGSARSIQGFHLFDALSQCSSLLENYGGHKYAAGLTVREENISGLREKMNRIACDTLCAEDLIPSLSIDCEIALSDVNMNLVNLVNKLEPYGEGNPEPIFCSRAVTVKSPAVVLGRGTLKFWVTDGINVFSAVGFGMESYRNVVEQGKKVDLAYKVSIDDWNKEPTVQLELKDIKEA
ncbi:MAG: single-stranded-DNA-specific exonuclease RecJ [Candidatus Omnitrophica bacterium]|nr:single-stranded-DNA-specific exonuclease RecJ [Candidatus Omnitrophota bacterium]